MAVTPDRKPGPSVEEEVQFEKRTDGDPTEEGAIRYVDGQGFRLRDSEGVFNPRSGGSGLTEGQHDALDDLVHELAESHYMELVRSGGRVTQVIAWTDSGKTVKVRELQLTRADGKVSQIVEIQYDGSGVEVQRMTGVVARADGRVSSITWTETGS